MSARKTGGEASREGFDNAMNVEDEVWQLVSLLSALMHQLQAIQNGEVDSVHDETHEAGRVCRDVRKRLYALGELLASGVEIKATHSEAQRLLEALK